MRSLEGYARLKGLFPIRGTVPPYDQFIASHRHFLVLGDYCHPTEWLLRKLEGDGAQLRIIGTYQGTYEDNDLYEVTFRTAAPQPIASLLARWTSSITGSRSKSWMGGWRWRAYGWLPC